MAWTFRKRKKLFPGVRLNYGSSGLSLNVGVPGASLTIGTKGVYANTGIPGTGIRSRTKIHSTPIDGDIEDAQITEQDEKRVGCVRNCIYFIGYLFSYAIIITLWIVTGFAYSTENYYYLIPAIIDGLFIINTIRMHLYHHIPNTSSPLTFSIVFTILSMIACTIAGIELFTHEELIGWTLCAMLDLMWAFNLYICFKYRVNPKKIKTIKEDNKSVSAYNKGTTIEENHKHIKEQTSIQETQKGKKESVIVNHSVPQHNAIQKPLIDYTKEGALFFADKRVRDELNRTYSPEVINVCKYVINVGKCILSDVQVSLGLSYQKVLEAVKLLEKTRIVKVEGNHRKVMVKDETTAIRLLLRYAKEQIN